MKGKKAKKTKKYKELKAKLEHGRPAWLKWVDTKPIVDKDALAEPADKEDLACSLKAITGAKILSLDIQKHTSTPKGKTYGSKGLKARELSIDKAQDMARLRESFEEWYKSHTVEDKDLQEDRVQLRRKSKNKGYALSLKVDASLDLHGLTSREAWDSMRKFTRECIRLGLHKIVFIHGKGHRDSDYTRDSSGHCNSYCTLKHTVEDFIISHDRLGTWGYNDEHNGGDGATWVIIKP